MTVFVNAADGFTEHSPWPTGRRAAGRAARGARFVVRSAVGVASLPGGACVEVELTCAR